MKKTVRIVAIAVGVLLLLWGVLLVGERILFKDFYDHARKEFRIPGLMAGYNPQGLDYMPEYDSFLTSGYMANGKASRVYLIDRDGKAKCSCLTEQDGTDNKGHTGGAAYFDRYCYIPNENRLEAFSLEDILSDSGTAAEEGKVQTPINPAWCTDHEGYLIAGEFYREGSHERAPEHRLTTPAGEENKALAVVYRLDAAYPCGIDPVPVAALSLPEKVQGLCVTDTDEVILSVSWGFDASTMLFYDAQKLQPQGTFSFDGTEVPLIYFDSAALTRTLKTPPMAEEVECVDGRLYIISESASNKYIYGKLLRGAHVYSYDLTK